jgi:hypothetical protein
LVLAGLMTVGHSDVPGLGPEIALIQLAPETRIKLGMTETQVERLLRERAGGTIVIGGCVTCGLASDPWHIRLYKRAKVLVVYEGGKVTRVSSWE